MSILISAVICTFNRAELLEIVLQTLCNQTLDLSYYEVIVVDNNSSDKTRDVADRFCNRHKHFRYCFETNQGVSHARNRGWREAKGEYVAYVDDECKVPEQWLSKAKDIIEKHNPGAFGGPILGYFKAPKPKWYNYGSHEPEINARFLNSDEYVLIIEGNAFINRKLIKKYGGFDHSFGPIGTKIGFGEGADLLSKIIQDKNGTIYFDPELYLYHLVLAKKWTWSFIIRASFVAGKAMFDRNKEQYSSQADQNYLLNQFFKSCLALTIDLLRGFFIRDRIKYPYIQNYLFENSLKYVRKIGKLYGQFLNSADRKVKPPSSPR